MSNENTNHPSEDSTHLLQNGIFNFGLLVMSGDQQGIAANIPTVPVNYTVSTVGSSKVRLNINPFTISIANPEGNFIVSLSGLLSATFAPTSSRYINFTAGPGIFGHVFRDGSVRFSGSLNSPLIPGTYNIPATTVIYNVVTLNLPTIPNKPIAQGLTDPTKNEGIFGPTTPSINNLEYFTILYVGGKIYAVWGDNSTQIKGPNPPDPYTRIAFAILNEDGTYVISPKNIGDIVPTTGGLYPPTNPNRDTGAQMEVTLAMDPTNRLKLNVASWSIENTSTDTCVSNFKGFYARSDDGGVDWQVLDLFSQNFVPKLQQDSITSDHFMKYDKFGNLFYEALSGFYNTLPFNITNVPNLRPLPQFFYSSNNGQLFDQILMGTPVHNDAFGLDYPEATVSEESDESSVYWLVMKQITTAENFNVGDTFPQLAIAVKMKGLHQFDSIRYIELPETENGGYGSMAAGKNGTEKDVAVTGIPVLLNFGALFESNGSIWFTHNREGFNGSFNGIKFFANTNVGFQATYPPQSSRQTWSQPNIAIDKNDRWYMAYVDGPVPTTQLPTQTDILLIYSDDKGMTWSPTYKVNDNANFSRIQPQVKVDPESNNVVVAWLDARDNVSQPGNAVLVRPYFAIIPNGFFPKLNLPREYFAQKSTEFFNEQN